MALLQSPFFQVTLPLMCTFIAAIWLASWSQNKRLEDIIGRLGRIESKLESHSDRITRLEERTSPFHR
jgi:cytochrome oxidase assembly protein ShyY1